MKRVKNWNLYIFVLLLLLGMSACVKAPTVEPTETATTIPVTATAEEEPTQIPATETSLPPTTIPTESQPTPTLEPDMLAVFIDGRWEGSLTISGTSIKTIVYFRTEENILRANLEIPSQNVFGYQLSEVSFDGVHVHFEGFEESNQLAAWDGELKEDGTIQGSFDQLGYKGSFELTRAEMVVSDEPPPPYQVEEVEIRNNDIILGGTLTIPEGEGPYPVFVLISGSGAQNRDEEIFGFKLFGIIADHFTRSGIAVLRYDDRGVGASTGNLTNSTSADLAGDVGAWVAYLATRTEINSEMIGLLGHSEGGLIAPMVAAATDDVAMIILLAGTAVPGEEIIYKQIELIARADGAAEEEIQEGLKDQKKLFAALLSGEGWEEEKAMIRERIAEQVDALPAAQKSALGDLDKYIDTVLEQQVSALESAWYLYFLTYDPGPTLEQVTVPVFGIFGELDLQVPPDPNAQVMEDALARGGNEDVTITIYPSANHIFQEAKTGSVSEYAALRKEFIPGLLDDLTNWILARVSTPE